MTYLPFFLYGDAATEPPETDDPPVLCTACGRAECGCGEDQKPAYCPRCLRHHARSGEAEERCQEVSRFIAQDHRRRGGEE